MLVVTALTRAVSPSLADCALTFQERTPIDVQRAMAQHAAYEDTLRSLGVRVVSLPAEPDLPDAVFVEDTAVVVDELAVLTAPRLPSRRREVASMDAALAPLRHRAYIQGDGTLEGGDVMRIGRDLYVGRSARTNESGIAQLAAHLAPLGYTVHATRFSHCLHLKSACTYIGRNMVLANRDWVDTSQFGGVDVTDVDPEEPAAANALLVSGHVVLPASFPLTCRRLTAAGFSVIAVDVSELQKAEAGVTCCSILLDAG
jgi:dimethylargininase